MRSGQPSSTALRVAAQRAAHQEFDGGAIFRDPFARVLLGPDADALIAAVADDRRMRFWFAARARFAEDCLHEAVLRVEDDRPNRFATQAGICTPRTALPMATSPPATTSA